MSYVCRMCDKEFAEIPPGAVLLASSRRGRFSYLYRFADGAVHDLRLVKSEPPIVKQELPQEKLPTPVVAEPQPPVEQIELVQEVEVLAESSEPVEEVTTTDDPETIEEVKPTTVVAAASRNLSR
jgi:hypothetical protein